MRIRAGEHERAEAWRLHVSALKAALERDGWDGEWYRRAYFDDGTPLGSAENAECRIDSIAQSWGVMSGAAEPGRAARAMGAVDQQLVRRPEGLILLFTPPFETRSMTQATSRVTCPASGKMAANTPMLPRGRSLPLRRSAMAIRPANYSGC